MKVRLQTSITVLLVGLILLTVIALGMTSYHFSRDSADQLRGRILKETARDIYGEINRLLDIAMRQTDYTRDRIEDGTVDPADFPAVARSWVRPLQTHPELAFMALSLKNGDTLRMGRSRDNQIYIQEWRLDPEAKTPRLKLFDLKDYPDRPRFSDADPRISEFHPHPIWGTARVARRGQLLWTETYGFLGEKGHPGIPGTACVAALIRKDKSRIGALAAGVNVLSLCEYLRSLKVGKEGFAFVAELHDDQPPSVIALPSADLVWRTRTKGPRAGDREKVPTAEINDDRVRAFMARLPEHIDRGADSTFVPLDFEIDGTHYCGGYEYLRDLPETDTPEWIICIVMPEKEIMGNVWRNNWFMLGLGLTTLVLAMLAGLYLARQVARPLEQVVGETRSIGRLDCEPRAPIHSHVQEVTDLGVALEEMKTSLRSYHKYVPVDLVLALTQSRQEARLGGTSRDVTIFFSDIANFTSISESLSPPELLAHLGEYLEAMSVATIATGGTVDKFIGDAVMAFWGAPLANPRHALAACAAALRCQSVLHELREKWRTAGKPMFTARIGLNTGEVVVGNIGSATRMNYTVIGDAVNVASRLEGLNKQYGTEIIISESTYREAGQDVVARPLDWVSVKGRTRALEVYELLGLRGTVAPEMEAAAQVYAEALKRYRQQDWQHAIELFGEVTRQRPQDPPSQRMLARCRTYLADPPGENWDGVYRPSEK
ncbi:MAG: adenylate/guanylate cyclase domain-containing protein [Gemmataceae bacterium]|nr:adenylate/guanylate cyclase domain-containing protein [Gemmataceae bacterium]